MPITRRQFELGIDPAIEEWMDKLYDFLKERKNEAYSAAELKTALGVKDDWTALGLIDNALEVLVRIGAVGVRAVQDETYYAFRSPFKKGTWEEDWEEKLKF